MSDDENGTTAGSKSAETSTGSRLSSGRLALIAAGLIAMAAVGISVYRSQDGADNAPPTSAAMGDAATQASVSDVIATLEERLRDNPDDAEGWRMLGWSYFETGQFAESVTAMRRAIALDEDNSEYHSMLGEALVMASKSSDIPQDAEDAFRTALEHDPMDARARYFMAAAKDIDGQHEEALDEWFALLADTPADAPYAEDIRTVIRDVAAANDIDVGDRLTSAKFAAPKGSETTDGASVATAAIPGPTRDQMSAASSLPPGQQEAMVQGMVEGLATRLKQNPNDADGWIMLMRSRMTLGETGKAGQALKEASAAFRNDDTQLKRIKEAAAALGVPGA